MFKHEDLQKFGRKLKKKVSNFHPRENMGRGSETQLQLDELQLVNITYMWAYVKIYQGCRVIKCIN